MNKSDKKEKMKNITAMTYTSEKSDFYKLLKDKVKKGDIPTVSSKDFLDFPLLKRDYLNKKMVTKVIHGHNDAFLLGRTIDDIRQESFGIPAKRPLMLFKYTYESIEKGLWFYEQKILPMINEDNLEITTMMASKYTVDGIVGEMDMIKNFTPILSRKYNLKNIKHIRIIDTTFDTLFMEKYFSHAEIFYTLGTPLSGSIASMCPESKDVFHEDEHALIENLNGKLVVTKLYMMPTPIIRLETGIPIQPKSTLTCSCQAHTSFTLQ